MSDEDIEIDDILVCIMFAGMIILLVWYPDILWNLRTYIIGGK